MRGWRSEVKLLPSSHRFSLIHDTNYVLFHIKAIFIWYNNLVLILGAHYQGRRSISAKEEPLIEMDSSIPRKVGSRRESLVPVSANRLLKEKEKVLNQQQAPPQVQASHPPPLHPKATDGTNSIEEQLRISLLQAEVLRELAEQRENEIQSLREFSNLELELLKPMSQQNQQKDADETVRRLIAENNRLQMQAAQQKGGYELLKRCFLKQEILRRNPHEFAKLQADAERVVSLVDI